jgi:hypothetical protein
MVAPENQGFVVVLKAPTDDFPFDPGYRGIDRMVGSGPQDLERGFDNPYIFGRFRNRANLIVSLPAARTYLEKFTEIFRPDEMEIIYCGNADGTVMAALPGMSPLGFDVACDSPFPSLINHRFDDPRFEQFVRTLNPNGLFDTAEEAIRYRTFCRENNLVVEMDLGEPVHVWEVSLASG